MKERPRLDLTADRPDPLEVPSPYQEGVSLRFTFLRLLTRQMRANMQLLVGKGRHQIETIDWGRLFRATVESVSGLPAGNGIPDDGTLHVDRDGHKALIEKVMVAPPPAGFPEDVVAQVVEHILGTNVLDDDEGNA